MIREIVRVDPERRSQWLLPSAIRVVPPAQMQHLLPVDPARPWQQGDLILGRVESVGMINRVQNVNRRGGIDYREAALFPGTVTVAVLAPRAGTSTCIAKVPPTPIDHLHLHGVGGQAGLVVPGTHHSALYRDPPTAIQVLAILAGPDQEPLNTRSFHSAIAECSAEPRPRTSRDPGLILVVGSDMDDGKTTTARRIIYSLRALGRPAAPVYTTRTQAELIVGVLDALGGRGRGVDREAARGKQSGRTQEIQRLIGRSLRAVVDLKKLGERQIVIDCDVIQADGGTRTAAITGAFVAAQDAVNQLLASGKLSESPIIDHVAAISVGMVQGTPLLDLEYTEDVSCDTDMNVVMTGAGNFVEVQGTAEGAAFSRKEMDALLALAEKGIRQLVLLQGDSLSD